MLGDFVAHVDINEAQLLNNDTDLLFDNKCLCQPITQLSQHCFESWHIFCLSVRTLVIEGADCLLAGTAPTFLLLLKCFDINLRRSINARIYTRA